MTRTAMLMNGVRIGIIHFIMEIPLILTLKDHPVACIVFFAAALGTAMRPTAVSRLGAATAPPITPTPGVATTASVSSWTQTDPFHFTPFTLCPRKQKNTDYSKEKEKNGRYSFPFFPTKNLFMPLKQHSEPNFFS